MFARLKTTGPDIAALRAVERVVQARFGLSESDLVLVREEPGRGPGDPEVMTTILFWHGGERHRIRLFKPVSEIAESDLPARWLRAALRDDGEADCC